MTLLRPVSEGEATAKVKAVFDDIKATGCPAGSSRCYHVYAFAGLVIEGFKFPGSAAWRDGNYQTACSTLGPGNSESCIAGHVESIIEPGAQTGGPNFGAVTIQLIG